MNKVFFKDVQGNYFDTAKIVGLFKSPTEEGGEDHFFALVDNLGQIEISPLLFTDFINNLIIIEAEEPEEEKEENE